MKKLFLLIFVSLTAVLSCQKDKIVIASNTPNCIRQQIEQIVADPNATTGAVDEYSFQGKTVYTFEPDNKVIADGSTRVVDTDCKTLCSVGGFGGPSINLCNGENFYQKAVLIRNIWKN
jgi:hypothetical protein